MSAHGVKRKIERGVPFPSECVKLTRSDPWKVEGGMGGGRRPGSPRREQTAAPPVVWSTSGLMEYLRISNRRTDFTSCNRDYMTHKPKISTM